MPRKLSVVADGATAPPAPRPKTIKAAAEMSERSLLVAMRSKVAAEIDGGVPAHALAPLMRQLRDFDKEIRAIDAREAQDRERGGEVEDGDFDASAV